MDEKEKELVEKVEALVDVKLQIQELLDKIDDMTNTGEELVRD